LCRTKHSYIHMRVVNLWSRRSLTPIMRSLFCADTQCLNGFREVDEVLVWLIFVLQHLEEFSLSFDKTIEDELAKDHWKRKLSSIASDKFPLFPWNVKNFQFFVTTFRQPVGIEESQLEHLKVRVRFVWRLTFILILFFFFTLILGSSFIFPSLVVCTPYGVKLVKRIVKPFIIWSSW